MATPSLARTITVEPGGTDDLDAVMVVMEAAFGNRFGEAWTRSQCAGILPMAGVSLTLARAAPDRRVVGFSLVRSVAGESELLLLGVGPEYQRQRIGSLLLDDFLDRARRAGATRAHLEVRDGNAATAMYRAAGFAAVGRRRNYYRASDGSRFDALTFARPV